MTGAFAIAAMYGVAWFIAAYPWIRSGRFDPMFAGLGIIMAVMFSVLLHFGGKEVQACRDAGGVVTRAGCLDPSAIIDPRAQRKGEAR